MLFVAHARLGLHVSYDSDRKRRAALTYARGELQQSLLTGWSPWDGTLPGRLDVAGEFRAASIAGLRERLETHGFSLTPYGLRGMRIERDLPGMLARLRAGTMHGIQRETMPSA